MTVPEIGLMFGIPVMGWMVPFAFLLSVLLVGIASESGTARITLSAAVIAFVTVILSSVICGAFVDFSYDGNTYHKQAVMFLAQGWNPLQEPLSEWRGFQSMYPNGDVCSLWIDHYARGTWLYGASMYQLTGWIEAGKSYTLVAMMAAALMLAALLRLRGFRKWQCALVALLAAVNPITVPQFITFYNDAFLMMELLLLLIGLYTVALGNACDLGVRRISMLVFVCAFTACVQTKFTGLAYAGLFSVAFLVVYGVQAAKARGTQDGRYAIRRFLIMGFLMLCTLIVAVGVLGYSPYITNFLNNGNPFYPLAGEGAVDIMTPNQPAIFASMSTLQKELVSLFSQFATAEAEDAYELSLKVPLSISLSELRELPACDTHISGFGILYSAIAIVNIVCVIPMLAISRKRWPAFFMGCIAYYVCVIVLMLLFSDGWWARYSSYRYFSSIILLAFLLKLWNETDRATFMKRVAKPLAVIFTGLLIANTALFLVLNTGVQFVRSCALNGQFIEMGQRAGVLPLHLASENAELGLLFNLDSMDIPYVYEGPEAEATPPAEAQVGHTHRFTYWFD